MRFAVFNADGEPVRIGSCPEAAIESQAQEGETAIPWDKPSPVTGWRLIEGELTEV